MKKQYVILFLKFMILALLSIFFLVLCVREVWLCYNYENNVNAETDNKNFSYNFNEKILLIEIDEPKYQLNIWVINADNSNISIINGNKIIVMEDKNIITVSVTSGAGHEILFLINSHEVKLDSTGIYIDNNKIENVINVLIEKDGSLHLHEYILIFD